jgi:hypothetical protein
MTALSLVKALRVARGDATPTALDVRSAGAAVREGRSASAEAARC